MLPPSDATPSYAWLRGRAGCPLRVMLSCENSAPPCQQWAAFAFKSEARRGNQGLLPRTHGVRGPQAAGAGKLSTVSHLARLSNCTFHAGTG